MKIVKDGRLIEPGPACRKLNPHLFGGLGPNANLVKPRSPSSGEATTPAIQQVGIAPVGGPIPTKASKRVQSPHRIRQNNKPLSNRLETEFGNYLHSVNWAGNGIYEQAITVRLANGLRYTPDWIVFRDGILWCYEVKGKHVWDDSIAKLKMAASKYREWKWVLAWKEGNEWKTQYVLP